MPRIRVIAGFLGLALLFGYLFLRSSGKQATQGEGRPERLQIVTAPEALPQVKDSFRLVETNNEDSALKKELKTVLRNLPTTADARELNEDEVHHTPEIVIEGGRAVGRLLETADKNPERRKETMNFFIGCAEDEDILPEIRAVCWRQVMRQIPKWKMFVPLSEVKVPEKIRLLGESLD